MITIALPPESTFPFDLEILIATIIIFIIIIASAHYLIVAVESKKKDKEAKKLEEQKSLMDNAKDNFERFKEFLRDPSVKTADDWLRLQTTLQFLGQQFLGLSKKQEPAPKDEEKDLIGTITGIGGFAISVLGVGLVPLIIFPLLDYSAYIQLTSDEANMTVAVRNIGFTSAKNVIVSIHADTANFSNLVSNPYLAEQFKKNVSSPGVAYAKLAVLPPRANVEITGVINTTNTNNDVVLTPYIFSEEGVGKVNRLWTLSFYTLLSAIYSIVFIYLYFRVKITKLRLYHVLLTMLLVGLYALGYFVIYQLVAIIPIYPQSRLF